MFRQILQWLVPISAVLFFVWTFAFTDEQRENVKDVALVISLLFSALIAILLVGVIAVLFLVWLY